MNKNLIFDIGMHLGENTSYYLHRGFTVVAVEANPILVKQARKKFASAIRAGKLILVAAAIADKNKEVTDFFVSKNTLWSSLNPLIANRENITSKKISVDTTTLPQLIAKYGVPYYCKIDIEGGDKLCLIDLVNIDKAPKFISVETECLEKDEQPVKENALIILNLLKKAGYRKFKLVDQFSLSVLENNTHFYGLPAKKNSSRSWDESLNKYIHRNMLSKKLQYDFPFGSAGPFAKDLGGDWLNYETAKKTLLFQRRDFFRWPGAKNYSFWCDWHAQ